MTARNATYSPLNIFSASLIQSMKEAAYKVILSVVGVP